MTIYSSGPLKLSTFNLEASDSRDTYATEVNSADATVPKTERRVTDARRIHLSQVQDAEETDLSSGSIR